MRNRRVLEALMERVEQISRDQTEMGKDMHALTRLVSVGSEDIGPRVEQDLDEPAIARAFNSLRRSVQELSRHRAVQAAQLAELDELLVRTDDLEIVRKRVAQWLDYAGIRKQVDEVTVENYDILGGGDSQHGLVVVTPAYVETRSGALIKRGTARASAQGDQHA